MPLFFSIFIAKKAPPDEKSGGAFWQGVELFPEEFGLDVHGDKMAEFVYPALSPLPDELWLAPIQDGVADMAAAVRVR